MDKAQIRRKMLTRRLAVSEEDYFCLATDFMRKACNLLLGKLEISTLAGYAPIHGEIDVVPLMEVLFDHRKTVALPVMRPGSRVLAFRRWEPGMALTLNRYGIAEPPESAPEVAPEVVLVPLLAFDRRGNRLGYGGGYYDATLTALSNALAAGCGYSWQQVKSLPAEPQDRLLNWIITEKSVRKGHENPFSG